MVNRLEVLDELTMLKCSYKHLRHTDSRRRPDCTCRHMNRKEHWDHEEDKAVGALVVYKDQEGVLVEDALVWDAPVWDTPVWDAPVEGALVWGALVWDVRSCSRLYDPHISP